jgi:hypothetical protein
MTPIPHGARGNGLPAERWQSLSDLDPQLADAMLGLLADAGVAAYALPVEGRLTHLLHVPVGDRPLDRLFVAGDAAARAREVLDSHLPELEAELEADADATAAAALADLPPDLDEAWQAIVAGYDQDAPGAEDRRGPGSPTPEPDDEPSPGRRTLRRATDRPDQAEQGRPDPPGADADWADIEARLAARSATSGPVPEPDDEDHFVPPTPPAAPRGDALTRWAWAGVLGGPLLLTLAALLGWSVSGWPALLGVVGFLAGFGTLVARMGDGPRVDDGPDDGAVV